VAALNDRWIRVPSATWSTPEIRAQIQTWIAEQFATHLPKIIDWRVEETFEASRGSVRKAPLIRVRLIGADGGEFEYGITFPDGSASTPERFANQAPIFASSLAEALPYTATVRPPEPGESGSLVLNEALAQMPAKGGTLTLTPQTLYDLTAEVYVPSNVTIVGAPGAVIKRAPFRLRYEGVSDCALIGVTFDIATVSNFDDMVRGTDVNRMVIRDCMFLNSGTFNPEWTIHAVLLNDDVYDLTIEDCYVQEQQLNIGRLSSARVTIRRCTFDRPAQYALSFVTAGTGTLSDLLVEDCTVLRMATSGAFYVGDDVASEVGGITSTVNNVILRRIKVLEILEDGGVSRSINLRPHNADNWLIEDVEMYSSPDITPNHFGVLVAPRRPGGIQSNFTLRNIFGRDVRFGSLSMTDADGDLSISNLKLEGIRANVYDGVTLSDVPSLLAKYGAP